MTRSVRVVESMGAGRALDHGVCLGVLSWLIGEGAADGTDLSGNPVALASRYSDADPGSPWTWILYLDAGASEAQRAALEAIFTGRLGGDAERHFPWAWKPSELVAARAVQFEVDHTRRRQRLRIRDLISVRIRDRYEGGGQVTCVIPGMSEPARSWSRTACSRGRGTCVQLPWRMRLGSTFDYAG
ncbi:MAG: DUF1326 domain-containing protein [Solirubrobacteraceae bacterium]